MKHRLLSLIALAALTLAGCQRTELEPHKGGGIDPSRQREVTLGAIRLTGDSPQAQAAKGTRATVTSTNMPKDSKFRLYAFERNKTEISDLLATRTYVIIDDNGTPELDGDQESLYLPVGELDIYLVGPTEAFVGSVHPTEHGQWVSIANESGVYPKIGVDLIASKTQITVKDGEANIFNANALSHKMSLVKTRVTVPSNAPYTQFVLDKVVMTNQAVEGTFTFGEGGGTITRSVTRPDAIIIDEVVTVTEHKEYYVESLLMPAERVDMKISIYFSCMLNTELVTGKRLNASEKPYELPAGQQVLFTAAPLIATELVFSSKVLPWDDKDMGEVVPPVQEDYLFWYDGGDAPITIDGKQYWPDRSGNGRHAELVGDIKYDAAGRYYYKINNDPYIKVPALGYLAPYTAEVVLSSVKSTGDANVAIDFRDVGSSVRGLYTHIPFTDGTIYYDCGGAASGPGRVSTGSLSRDTRLFENVATWGFSHEGTATSNTNNGKIWRNGAIVTESNTLMSGYPAFNDNRLLTGTCSGMKIYGARMVKKALSANELKANAANDMSRIHSLNGNVTDKGYPSEPIKEGLILDLRGTDGPNTSLVSGKKVWQDRSGLGNHAEIFGSVGYTSPYYLFTTSVNDYMKLINSLGANQEFTVEIVAMAVAETSHTGAGNGGSLINFGPTIDDASRSVHLHYVRGANVVFNSPYRQGGRNYISVAAASLPSPIPGGDIYTKQFHLSLVRKPGAAGSNGMVARINGTVIGTADATTMLEPMHNCYIGTNGTIQPSGGKLYAIRFYNRVLSEKELQYNYEFDKGAYNILP